MSTLKPSGIGKIFELEAHLRTLPQIKLALTHLFCDCMYLREMFIPAGTVLTGKIHKKEHFFICSSGKIAIHDEHGSRHITAGDVFISKPGTKRAGFAIEDTRIINVLRMSDPKERDIDKLEDEFVCETVEQFEQFQRNEETACLTHSAE